MGEVVELNIPPKTINRTYKRHKFVVTFVPATKMWHYEIELVHITKLVGEGTTQIKAIRLAEKDIDNVLKVQGRETG